MLTWGFQPFRNKESLTTERTGLCAHYSMSSVQVSLVHLKNALLVQNYLEKLEHFLFFFFKQHALGNKSTRKTPQ